MPGQLAAAQQQAEQRTAPLSNHRSARGAGHTPVQAEHEPQVEQQIEQVDAQQDCQRRAGVLRAEKPADQRLAGQHRRQAE